ncbi:MAG: excisionase [Lachnospiraceae bacterium]|nr:excisionase [Clostridia bacterium]MDD7208782.1 excisionase [Lachnospiraceae bacterium]
MNKESRTVPIFEKANLTIEEAAAYSGIGQHKIRELAKRDDADFALYCGRKLLIKRKRFDDYIDHELII